MSICRRGPEGAAVTDEIPIETAEFGVFVAAGGNKKVASALTHAIVSQEPLRMCARKFGVLESTLRAARKRLRRLGDSYRQWRAEQVEAENWN